MQLTFLGTRGAHVRPGNGHLKHSALLVEQHGQRLLIDCGSDWSGLLGELQPDAVLISHAHDDHAGGLDASHPCPVWASTATWEVLAGCDLPGKQTFTPRQQLRLCGCTIEPWPLVHSFRSPAVGFRIESGASRLFYAPDVAALPDGTDALAGVDLFIGDGAAFDASLLRVENDQLCGHAPLPQQLSWCIKAGVPKMLITHCGETLVSAAQRLALAPLEQHAARHDIRLAVARDGLQLVLP